MPKIEKIFTLEITPEQYLNACSLDELQEIDLLLTSALERKKERKKGCACYSSSPCYCRSSIKKIS